MGLIEIVKESVIWFKVKIRCMTCLSYNCDHYVAELSPNPRESDLAIRYRCLDCGCIADNEAS